jgi:hypothetical protein
MICLFAVLLAWCVCLSLRIVWWLHSAYACLAERSHCHCEGSPGSRGWYRSQGQGKKPLENLTNVVYLLQDACYPLFPYFFHSSLACMPSRAPTCNLLLPSAQRDIVHYFAFSHHRLLSRLPFLHCLCSFPRLLRSALLWVFRLTRLQFDGKTALILASRWGHTKTVQVLVKAGADKKTRDWVRERETERIKHARMWFMGGLVGGEELVLWRRHHGLTTTLDKLHTYTLWCWACAFFSCCVAAKHAHTVWQSGVGLRWKQHCREGPP